VKTYDRTRALWRKLCGVLAGEAGQGMTEYALTSFFLIVGTSASLLVFLPNTIALYKAYIESYYVILGMPFP
jgi:hypothetical protein